MRSALVSDGGKAIGGLMEIYSVPQMLRAEKRSDELGVSLSALMDNAGKALADEIERECVRLCVREPVILVGKGNNGGDGIVAARLLSERGFKPVTVLCCGKPSTELAVAAMKRLGDDVEVTDKASEELICSARVLVDCIFGTGFRGEIIEELRPLFADIEKSSAFVIACDIPSGANARNGEVSELAVRADLTVTMHRGKLGMYLSPARYHCGEVRVCDIGIPEGTEEGCEEFENHISLYDASVSELLPERPQWGHKGTFGRAVCICGSSRYFGAAKMSCEAALRTGAGLVELLSTEKCIDITAPESPECIYTRAGSGETLTASALPMIEERLRGASAVLIGCGLGCSSQTEELVKGLVEMSQVPLVIDADGINSLCVNIDVLLKKKSEVILTPHPAELARLCGVSVSDVMSDRVRYAAELAGKYGVTVVSKSAETIVTNGTQSVVVQTGNTALSKGGSGDMLAGAIVSLTAQRPDKPLENSILAALIIGESARALSEVMSPRGIIARDILGQIPLTLKKFES